MEHRELEVAIARQVDRAIPAGWDSLRYEVLGVRNVFSHMIHVLKGDVEDPHFPPIGLAEDLNALKESCYQPNVGTWLEFTIMLSSSGELTIDCTFDAKPDFDPSFRDYELELERFPRNEEAVPSWWRERIARGDE